MMHKNANLVAAGGGGSEIRLNALGFRIAGQSNRRKMNPDTALVLTSLSLGHLVITFLCKQLQMYLTGDENKTSKIMYIICNLRTNLNVLGQASEDMKIDSVMSSKTCKRNSALAHASATDSILLGFNSQLCLDSKIRWIVGKMAVDRKSVHTDLM